VPPQPKSGSTRKSKPSTRVEEPAAGNADPWVADEHARRQGWLAGPTEAERAQWEFEERRRRLQFAPPAAGPVLAVGPTDEEIDRWAAEEHKRRQAWLEGPSELERQEWARSELDASARLGTGPAVGPTDAEVDRWAAEEQKRRRAWAAGPSANERPPRRSHRSQARERRPRMPFDPGTPPAVAASRLHHDVELATRGAFYMLTEAPYWAWERLLGAGQEWEAQFYEPSRRSRVRLYDP
jgi:hypothetical protein